ncbi:hypothetical protein Dimus_028913, partial [Dionaea muscipula]
VAREPADEDALSRRPSRTHPCTHNARCPRRECIARSPSQDPIAAAELVAAAHDAAEVAAASPLAASLRALLYVRCCTRFFTQKLFAAIDEVVVTAPLQFCLALIVARRCATETADASCVAAAARAPTRLSALVEDR